MARTEYDPKFFESLAADMRTGADALEAIASMMRENSLPKALIHGSSTKNVYLPAILDWVDKASADVKSQIRSHLSQVQSNAELQKQKSDNQKAAAAKKTIKKK